jgi:hypothetical protein
MDEDNDAEDGSAPRGVAAQRREAVDAILVAALAAGNTYQEAGRQAGVTERTVGRRMATPEFSSRVAAAREERVAVMCGALTDLAPRAVERLAELVRADEHIAIQAVRETLTQVFRARRQYQLEADVRALRAELEELRSSLNPTGDAR